MGNGVVWWVKNAANGGTSAIDNSITAPAEPMAHSDPNDAPTPMAYFIRGSRPSAVTKAISSAVATGHSSAQAGVKKRRIARAARSVQEDMCATAKGVTSTGAHQEAQGAEKPTQSARLACETKPTCVDSVVFHQVITAALGIGQTAYRTIRVDNAIAI